jgi:molybdopterin-guanine dinucleotide biosynthesis protein A
VTVLPKSSDAIAEAGVLAAIMTAMRVQRENSELQIAACRCPFLPFLLLFFRSQIGGDSVFSFQPRKNENIELLLEVRETEACRGQRDRGMQTCGG